MYLLTTPAPDVMPEAVYLAAALAVYGAEPRSRGAAGVAEDGSAWEVLVGPAVIAAGLEKAYLEPGTAPDVWS